MAFLHLFVTFLTLPLSVILTARMCQPSGRGLLLLSLSP